MTFAIICKSISCGCLRQDQCHILRACKYGKQKMHWQLAAATLQGKYSSTQLLRIVPYWSPVCMFVSCRCYFIRYFVFKEVVGYIARGVWYIRELLVRDFQYRETFGWLQLIGIVRYNFNLVFLS